LDCTETQIREIRVTIVKMTLCLADFYAAFTFARLKANLESIVACYHVRVS